MATLIIPEPTPVIHHSILQSFIDLDPSLTPLPPPPLFHRRRGNRPSLPMERADLSRRDPHGFMNVESFSQLPFIRPAPPPPADKGGSIRLFGIDFGDAGDSKPAAEEPGGEIGRKFKCHYCCRNFPTSQALGGHQNAHKRERLHAKRAHLQSVMVHGGLPDAHLYGLLNCHLIASAAPLPYPTPPAARGYFSHHHPTSLPPPTLNGSPLGYWRGPPVQTPEPVYDRTHLAPQLLGGGVPGEGFAAAQLVGGSDPRTRFACPSKPGLGEHVSLDLRL